MKGPYGRGGKERRNSMISLREPGMTSDQLGLARKYYTDPLR